MTIALVLTSFLQGQGHIHPTRPMRAGIKILKRLACDIKVITNG